MAEITDEMIERAARSDAEFDGRPWDTMGRHDRDRYMARARLALTAVAPMLVAQERERCAGIADDHARSCKEKLTRYRKTMSEFDEGLYESAIGEAQSIAFTIREAGNV